MTKMETLYLGLVLGAFSAFAIAMAIGTIADRAWARREARKNHGR